ncbi:hypothetical protein B5S28_g4332 [[Candida] boidinii]|nr:hypothetical protein B5S28_g4332 [[Candida] boidinii]
MRQNLVLIALSAIFTTNVLSSSVEQELPCVFKFSSNHQSAAQQQQNEDKIIPVLDENDALINLADELGISDYYNLDQLNDINSLELLGQSESFQDEIKPRLILIVNGIDSPSNLLSNDNIKPNFKIDNITKKGNSFFKFVKDLPNKFINYNEDKQLKLNKLSNEIILINEKFNENLIELWVKYFNKNLSKENNLKLNSFWNQLKDSFYLNVINSNPSNNFNNQEEENINSNSNSNEIVNLKNSLNFINDELFINELSQLDFFLSNIKPESEKIIINLNSLNSIYKKTGKDSQTYNLCKKIMTDLINKHLSNIDNTVYDTTIIALPMNQQILELNNIDNNNQFSKIIKRDENAIVFKSNPSCFISEDACESSTESCSGHGKCTKFNKCWKCVCVPTQDDKKTSTTYWTGSACNKKDVSVEFNLFLWIGIVLTFAFAAGIKLLVSCGEESLPGVLIAATMPKKSSN